MYLTVGSLGKKYFQNSRSLNESYRRYSSLHRKVFLSYRRKDRDLVTAIVTFLLNTGANVYVDYLDNELPDEPDVETACILRKRIKDCQKFILIATPNSKDSRWIPWELGLGDGFIEYRNVTILPITNDNNYWNEIEYYRVYGYIKQASSTNNSKYDWAVLYPDNKNNVWLNEWLSK